MGTSHIGIYGLGVMGRSLALNLEEKGNFVSVYNRKTSEEKNITTHFLSSSGEEKNFYGAETIPEFVSSLQSPRKILIMVKAGKPVDDVIDELLPLLEPGDVLIDGGNSHYTDTNRRIENLTSRQIHFVGMGVSGGEEGARFGPSLMPGGKKDTWNDLKKIFEPIAAKSFNGTSCCLWMGNTGAGHFIKMVHNGIEYADMQLLAEAYHMMKTGFKMSSAEISEQFLIWNAGPLESYLTEITSKILTMNDEDGNPLADKILDSAGQKGTGKWMSQSALEEGIPLPGISEAVFMRFISSLTDIRKRTSETLPGPSPFFKADQNTTLAQLTDALIASRMMCHAEGFFLITETARKHEWDTDPVAVTTNWQGGCIIRSRLLADIAVAFEKAPSLPNLALSPIFSDRFRELQNGWRSTISLAVTHGIPVPVMSASLAQYDALRSARLPANLIQAQRDYFGAHFYERIDKPRGEFFHTDWKKFKEN